MAAPLSPDDDAPPLTPRSSGKLTLAWVVLLVAGLSSLVGAVGVIVPAARGGADALMEVFLPAWKRKVDLEATVREALADEGAQCEERQRLRAEVDGRARASWLAARVAVRDEACALHEDAGARLRALKQSLDGAVDAWHRSEGQWHVQIGLADAARARRQRAWQEAGALASRNAEDRATCTAWWIPAGRLVSEGLRSVCDGLAEAERQLEVALDAAARLRRALSDAERDSAAAEAIAAADRGAADRLRRAVEAAQTQADDRSAECAANSVVRSPTAREVVATRTPAESEGVRAADEGCAVAKAHHQGLAEALAAAQVKAEAGALRRRRILIFLAMVLGLTGQMAFFRLAARIALWNRQIGSLSWERRAK